MTKLKFGDIARDKITGFQGVVVARTIWLNNCDRLLLQPREVKDGKPLDGRSFDEPNLEFVETTDIKVFKVARPDEKVVLGDIVRDVISNLSGVAIARTEWMNGCSRVTVQPKELKDGLPVESSTFDESDLQIVTRAIPPKPRETGGPRPEPARR